MILESFKSGQKIYLSDSIVKNIYLIVDGKIGVKFFRNEYELKSKTCGEWAIESLEAKETIYAVDDITTAIVDPQNLRKIEKSNELLQMMISSTSERLKLIDYEYTGALPLERSVSYSKIIKRLYPGSYELTDTVFQDYSLMKFYYNQGDYKSALSICLKYLSSSTEEELRKEFFIWNIYLNMLLNYSSADAHFRKIFEKEYHNLLSYRFLLNFYSGGKQNDLLNIFMKSGLHLPKNTFVVHEGDFADKAYLVLNGFLKVIKVTEDSEVLLTIIKPGELFGEGALFESKRRLATVITISPVDLIPLSEDFLIKNASGSFDFGLKVISANLKRILTVKNLIEFNSIFDERERIIKIIKYLDKAVEKAEITVKDISEISKSTKEAVIEVTKSLGYKVTPMGVIKP